jgi:hypothetical protein
MKFPPDDMQERLRRAQRATPTAAPARRTGGVDNGTVALAISGMTYYWLMPMMAGRRRKRRRPAANEPTAQP